MGKKTKISCAWDLFALFHLLFEIKTLDPLEVKLSHCNQIKFNLTSLYFLTFFLLYFWLVSTYNCVKIKYLDCTKYRFQIFKAMHKLLPKSYHTSNLKTEALPFWTFFHRKVSFRSAAALFFEGPKK